MKPGDFSVGIVAFFSILVPGAVAIAVLAPFIDGKFLKSGLILPDCSSLTSSLMLPADPAAGWAIFLTCAYFVGHLIYFIGSYLDRIHEIFREKRCRAFKKTEVINQDVFNRVKDLREDLPSLMLLEQSINNYQWSRSVLASLFPAAASEVHELEAASKFFRSLFVVLCVVGITFLTYKQWLRGFVALLLAIPCFIRFYEQRLKSTTQAYLHTLTLYQLGRLAVEMPPNPAPAADG